MNSDDTTKETWSVHAIIMLLREVAWFYNVYSCYCSAGINIVEIGHDFTLQLKNWLDKQGIKNSFDSWHG